MTYEIQSKNYYGQWDPSTVGNTDNEFESEQQAEEAIGDLRKLGGEWADAEYRVCPISE